MQHVNVLVKPASSACNMSCGYCFYQDVAGCREQEFQGFLSVERMEQIVRDTMSLAQRSCTFLFQGGEPVLAGPAFYEEVVRLQKKYQKPGVLIFNSLQTNGYEVGEDLARLFAREHFLIGVSLDGPEAVHDKNRRSRGGKGTFERVMETIGLFDRLGVEYNILSVVTGENAGRAEEIYRFFRSRDFRWLQFIPCLDPLNQQRGTESFSLTPEEYGRFLICIFDLWYEELRRGEYVSIRHLDNWMAILLGRQPACCGMMGRCSIQFVVEGDGGVYPCDFYVLDQLRLGTVGEQSFAQMADGPAARSFLKQSEPVPEDCSSCRYYVLCRNGCRRDRIQLQTGEYKNYYCRAYKMFFASREKELERAAGLLA